MELSPQKSKKNKSIRGNPEGRSLLQKEKMKLVASTKHEESKHLKHKIHDNIDDIELNFLSKKTRKFDLTEQSSIDPNLTPNSLSQLSSIMPVSDMSSMYTTYGAPSKSPKKSILKPDMSWECAVERARGQPDGADSALMHRKPSKAPIQEDPIQEESGSSADVSSEQENKPSTKNVDTGNGILHRGKSIKLQIKQAARKLKSLKTKEQLDESRASKRKLKDKTLSDISDPKKPNLKDLPRKERKKLRKTLKTSYNEIERAKAKWEELRRHDITPKRKEEVTAELVKLVQGKIRELSFAHDTARVVQCLIQNGNADQRAVVFDELKDCIPVMAKSKYSKYLIRKIMMYGTKQQKNHVIKSFQGQVRKLIRHREAAEVIEYCYNEYCNAAQRLSVLEEFYGPTFLLFKTPDIKSLDQIMRLQPDKREMILSNMKETLLPLIDKSILIHSLVHKMFFDFFAYANQKMRSEMIEALREVLMYMIHTRDGTRVAMQCIWHGTVKDRKAILKSMKGHVAKVCKEEYGHMLLFAIFDCVDDTKIVQKIVLDEMLKSVKELAMDQHARKILLYLLSPRDTAHFHPDVIKILQEADNNATSKKDKSVRRAELLEHVSPILLQFIVDHAKELVLDNASLLLVLTIITHAMGDPTASMEAISKIAAEPFVAGSLDNQHIVEHPAGHMTMKKLIMNDRERIKMGQKVLFAKVLLQTLPEGRLKSWAACNRGCFTLVCLLELEHTEVTRQVIAELSTIKKSIRKMTLKGAQILLQKLDLLS